MATFLHILKQAARRAVDTLVEVAKDANANYNITNIMPAGRSKVSWVTMG